MIEKIRQKILGFINSVQDTPVLAGFSIGFYLVVFYFSKNIDLVVSWFKIMVLIGYYMVLPIIVLWAGYKLLGVFKLSNYRKNYLFTGMIFIFAFFLMQLIMPGVQKKMLFGSIIVAAALLSLKLKQYYKLFIVLLLFMSVFNFKPLLGVAWTAVSTTSDWKTQPDDIERVVFKAKPNVYYIQPDGYTSFDNLKKSPYNFDNSDYEGFLKQNGFTLYNDYRSNYYSTLLSNSATFSMKHHFSQKDVQKYGARSIIVSDNPVLRIFKNNGYKTSFITEKPYIIVNRPKSAFDFININYNEIPYLKDGMDEDKDVFADLKKQIAINKKEGNFYFVEKFLPSHIAVYSKGSKGVEGERQLYLQNVKKSNAWLKEVVHYIESNDPEAVIVIGADHGGYVGFANTTASLIATKDKSKIYSMFGAQLAIKWNNPAAKEYDKGLTTGINLFRTLFSFLAQDKKYLTNLQDNSSFVRLNEPEGVYKYIDNTGQVVFEKQK